MADGAVNFLLEKLTTLILQHSSLLGSDGLEGLEDIKLEFESMKAFLKDADRREESDEGVGSWVRQVRDVAYEVEDVIDELMHHQDRWRRRKGVNGIKNYTIYLPKIIFGRQKIASKLQKIKVKVHEVSERSKRYGFNKLDNSKSSNKVNGRWHTHGETSLFVDEDEIVGMEGSKSKLLLWLSEEEPRRTIISILGMGGLGKTTLVTKVYNEQIVKSKFDCWAWVSVSPTYGIQELLLSLIKEFMDRDQVTVPRSLGSMNYRQLVDLLISYLHDKRYVIVLDDVWSINLWSVIRGAFPNNRLGSRVILTTRNENVASSTGVGSRLHRLKPLLYDDAWTLFCKKSFWRNQDQTCPPDLKEIAQVILKKCEGLPLAIVSIGGLLSSKDQTITEWKRVHESLSWQLNNNEILERRVKPILLLSFNDLPFYLKHCFLYCSVFQNGYLIKRKKLIRLWVAEGFVEERKGMTMEEVAEDYIKELIFRSMIQIVDTNEDGRVKTCRLHDYMREMALTTSEKMNFCTTFDGRESTLSGKIRRLSIYNSGENIRLSKTTLHHLRSLFLFKIEMSPPSLYDILEKFKLLRVLDLEGAVLETVPNALVGLTNLRYLNLRDTKLKKLPKSIGKLKNLQTLDIRNTQVERLPIGLTKLSHLRHLYVYRYYNPDNSYTCLRTLPTPEGIWNLLNLQTLAWIEAGEGLIKQVGNLSELRRFEVTKLRAKDGPNLCFSVAKMSSLLHLGIMATNEEELLQLELLSPPTFLQDLTLVGRLQRLPPWVGSLNNLTHLYLGWSRLGEEMLHSLQVLSNLLFLELKKAYEGKMLHFHTSFFPRLTRLNLCQLTRLDCIIIEDGALPSIRFLSLVCCSELKMLPIGIERLTGLEDLHLDEMPEEFVHQLQAYSVT